MLQRIERVIGIAGNIRFRTQHASGLVDEICGIFRAERHTERAAFDIGRRFFALQLHADTDGRIRLRNGDIEIHRLGVAQSFACGRAIDKLDGSAVSPAGNEFRHANGVGAFRIIDSPVIENTPIREPMRIGAQVFGHIVRAESIVAIREHAGFAALGKQFAAANEIGQRVNFSGIR